MLRFKTFGVTIELHFSLLILVVIGVYFGSGIFVIYSALFSFIHEVVHGSVSRILGYRPEKISLGLFGGVIHLREGFINPRDELFIHLSGPFFNLIAAALMYFTVRFQSHLIEILGSFTDIFFENFVWPVLLSNLLLGCFNLLPFYPLDGGKVINIYLAFFYGYGKAEKISSKISSVFSVLLFLLGIYLTQYNLMNCLMCALAVNLFVACKQSKTFIFYKVSKNIEGNCNSQSCNNSQIAVYREKQKAMKVIESYKPWDNHIFTVVNDVGAYKGQLSEEEFLNGVYEFGIYADFERLLNYKKCGFNI